MTWVNTIMAVLAIAGLAASAFGWRHSLRIGERSAEFYFALAKVLYSIGMGGRLLLWDVIVPQQDNGVAIVLYDGGVNVVFLTIILAGVYCSLRARHLLIRDEERGDWPWYLAWLHPRRPIWRR